MDISSEAPCRVDLAGSTLDIWPLYLFHASPVTLNFAVNRYARCRVRTRDDGRIVLSSRDLNATEEFASLDELRAAPGFKLPLLARALEFFTPENGVEIQTDSEAPAGAGISGSSALLIALASALAKLTGRRYGKEKIREIAQNIEARVIRVPTGSQDYYPALYGGVSAVELNCDGIARYAIPVDVNELNAHFVLVYTGAPRNSGINNWEVMKAHIDGDRAVHRNFDHIAGIAQCMRAALIRSDWEETSRLLREEWSWRRQNIPAISTPLIDALVDATAKAGAAGAKVCGAGGGGCVLILTPPEARSAVEAAVRKSGAELLSAKVAEKGVRTQ